jgi:hypothetical protein
MGTSVQIKIYYVWCQKLLGSNLSGNAHLPLRPEMIIAHDHDLMGPFHITQILYFSVQTILSLMNPNVL